MTDVQKILNEFYEIRKTGYGNKLPGEHDFKFIDLAEHYANADASEREVIRSSVNDDIRLLLIGFSDRVATLADRLGNKRYLYLALLAHSIEDFRYDNRENIFRLSLINHVAEKLHEDPHKLFETAALLSSSRGAVELRAFNSRPPELKSLRAMGILEEQTDDGVNYRYQ